MSEYDHANDHGPVTLSGCDYDRVEGERIIQGDRWIVYTDGCERRIHWNSDGSITEEWQVSTLCWLWPTRR